MSGKRLLVRTLAAMTLGILAYLLLDGALANATPIHPDPEKLVREPEATTFVPARAGWERQPSPAALTARNPLLDSIRPERINRDFREMAAAVAIPDAWLVLILATAIFLMRALIRLSNKRMQLRQSRQISSRDEMAA